MIRALIIDDDEALASLLARYLQPFGFHVAAAPTAEDGLRALRRDAIDVVILDVMLPGMDGFAVLRRIRETSSVPVVMLTARGEVTDRVVGLETGADDYLPKPFEPRELVARLHAVLRRGPVQAQGALVRAGAIVIDPSARTVTVRGQALSLTTAEFDLLLLLARHRGRVLSRERIMDETRGLDWEAYDRSIDVLVSRLRQKLGDTARQPSFIRTIRGAGYTLSGGDE